MADGQREHQPVLAGEVIRLLDPQPGATILDGTVGLGGHAALLLRRILPGGRYIGLDLDETMLAEARARLADFGPAITLVQANFADFPDVLAQLGVQRVDHMLLDLGVNSAQLSDASRGFSFEREGPLDMRFDREGATTALELVNRLPERELADLIYEYGQESASRKIAKRICQVRHGGRITTTGALARAVVAAVAPGGPRGKIHPATRVFQALRIAVNDELGNLRRFLAQAVDFLRPGGKLAVISFHSLEDAIVKQAMRAGRAAGSLDELTRRPVIADPQERAANPRSRSAKLRVGLRLAAEESRRDV
ncbi:MAG: 16S rRNA (cytosine(1402)-N(4))-methyltransferase RsmH [Planctomycetota bacterium]